MDIGDHAPPLLVALASLQHPELERVEVRGLAFERQADVHAFVNGIIAGFQFHERHDRQVAVRLAGLDQLGLVEAVEILVG